jgi:hypothetical protein
MANFTLVVKGTQCKAEMDWGQASNRHGYYLITTVWADLGGSKVVQKRTKVPSAASAIDDIDESETRRTEAALCSGPEER